MNINDVIINQNRISGSPQLIGNESVSGEQGRLTAADALLSDLKAGDSLQAQVLAKDGNAVTLLLPGNSTVQARISGNLNLDIGKLLTFEVKGSSQGLTLSPLFTNLSSDPNITKALNMAGLPVNQETALMTRQMMSDGMSIDRASLQSVFRDVSMYSGSDISDIVDLHRLGIEVNDKNLQQIDSYKNLSYQLGEGMNNVLNDLGDSLSESISSGDIKTAGQLFSQLAHLASEIETETAVKPELSLAEDEEYLQDGPVKQETAEAINPDKNNFVSSGKNTAEAVNNPAQALKEAVVQDISGEKPYQAVSANNDQVPASSDNENLSAAERALRLLSRISEEAEGNNGGKAEGFISAQEKEAVPEKTGGEQPAVFNKLPADENTRSLLSDELAQFTDKETDAANKSLPELFDLTKSLIDRALSENDMDKLSKMLGNRTIRDSIFGAVSEQWSISPAEVSEKEKVVELYNKLNRQLGMIRETLENVGLKNSPAGESVTNMSNNLDFLNQVNQMYSYIQLPIKLSGGDSAHGDLYVYSNGKKLSMKDGKVSALLHLDMEHLGPVDVYVSMDTTQVNKKLNTQFYVADESILDFIEEHMGELTERLQSKGYSVSAKTTVKGSKEAEGDPFSTAADGGGINGILPGNGGIKLSEYSFDVRT